MPNLAGHIDLRALPTDTVFHIYVSHLNFTLSDAVINSAWFFFVAGAVMSVALVLCGCGFGARKRKILMFTSGVAFIVAGGLRSSCMRFWSFAML